MASRRTFIQVGIGGAALFAIARLGAPAFATSAPAYRVLDERSAGMVKALAPVVMGNAFPLDAALRERAVSAIAVSFDRGVSCLPAVVKKEISDLFAFLDFAPTRVAFAGLWSPVAESPPEELAAFLTRWRNSRFELQQASYQALAQLIHASWYDMQESWNAISYPGPPPLPR